MNVKDIRSAHFVGIGGINMSAVAKLLLAAGVRVSGSDAVESEQTKILAERGATVTIGQKTENVPAECDVVIYTSAAPEANPEREEARRRNIPEMTNFAFLGEWFKDDAVILVVGTHGKSTTTAMLGSIFEKADMDPTVIVGSKLPSFPDGNLRIGHTRLVVIEGDEYAKHFLEFHPQAIILNNIELDHTDVFPNIEEMIATFRELVGRLPEGGVLVANMNDANVRKIVGDVSGPRVIPFTDAQPFSLQIPGEFNRRNATGAALMAKESGVSDAVIHEALSAFPGIWRRFEYLRIQNGARIYSDYGHHPTAVAATLAAAKESFPSSRVLLCFQPHHRNRTKNLFLDFVTSFDLADVLVLCEIYDVKGRDAKQDESVSSKDLVDAIVRHDADREVKRVVEYASDPKSAVDQVLVHAKEGDVVIVMGAGDIDDAIRNV